MQILLGANETVIKINSKSIKIDYIQHFINTHFSNVTINNNMIFIPKEEVYSYHRTFLLKWFYSFYVKKTKNNIPKLKSLLIERQHKAIRIELKERILYKIFYLPVDKEKINITIMPPNSMLAFKIKTFLNNEITILHNCMQYDVTTDEQREVFKKLLQCDDLVDISYRHLYDKVAMKTFLNKEKQTTDDYIEEACLIFGITPDDNKKTIKKRYKQLAKIYHPDKANPKDNEKVVLYTQKFQNILQAYEMLLEQVG